MNTLIRNNILEIKGMDNALKVAKTLLKQDYQVFVQLEDFDIYIVSYALNDANLGTAQFALLEADEEEYINNYIAEKRYREARDLVHEHDHTIESPVISKKNC